MANFILKSKILLLAIGLMFLKTAVTAQSSLTFEGTQLLTNFKFLDSAGTQDKSYKPIYCGAYSFGYMYISKGGFMLRANVGMRKAGATMVYDAMTYKWDLQYASAKLGLGYIYNKKSIKPYFNASFYYAYLLKANQVLNNQNFDILESKSIQNYDYGVFITPGVQYAMSGNISFFTEFNYMLGLQNLETGSNGQKTYNNAFALTLGVVLHLNCKKSDIKK